MVFTILEALLTSVRVFRTFAQAGITAIPVLPKLATTLPFIPIGTVPEALL